MIPTAADKIAFCTKHFKSPKGEPFDVTPPGRRWVVDELFRPADGYRAVARDVTKLCEPCKNKVEKIADRWDWRLQDSFNAHRTAQTDCLGLDLKAILVTVVNYPRRGGKSFNTYSWLLSTLCMTKRRRACVIAASEDQVKRIIKENIHEMVAQSPYLASKVKITASAGLIEIPTNHASLRIWTASAKSIAGSSYAYILLDEAATTDPAPFIKLIFSTGDAGRLECPRGCEGRPYGGTAPYGGTVCASCGDRMIPWHPRLIIFSSSGVLTGDAYSDWFQELIEALEAHPHAQAHLYRSETNTNPSVDPTVANAYVEIFGRVEALSTLVQVEASNLAMSLSDDFLSSAQVKASLDPNFVSVDADERPCVGFLDTSVSNDYTSLWILADHVPCASEPSDVGRFRPFSAYPWDQLRTVHLKIWDPHELPGGVIRADIVREHFDRVVVPNFPGLRVLVVDTRGSAWAKHFTIDLQALPIWGRKIKLMHKLRDEKGEKIGVDLPEFAWGAEDKKSAWDLMITRIALSKLWLPGGAVGDRLVREFRGVVRDPKTGMYRDKSKSKMHADLTDAIACGCLLALREQTRKARGEFYRDVPFGAAERALRAVFRSPVADLLKGGH